MNLYNLVKGIVPSRSSVQLLRFALVLKHILYVTDLDNYLVLGNTSLGDGFHVLDLLKHEIDQPQKSHDKNDYPKFPKPVKPRKFYLPVSIFNDRYESFVSHDETRFSLRGIFFGNNGSVVATDGHVMQCQDNRVKVPEDFILPVQSYLIVKNIIKELGIEGEIDCSLSYHERKFEVTAKDKGGNPIIVDGKEKKEKKVEYTKSHIFFYFPNHAGYFVCKLTQGVYPQYQQVIPKNKQHLELDLSSGKHDFLKTLRGAFEIAHTRTRSGIFKDGKLIIVNEDKYEKPVILDAISIAPSVYSLSLAYLKTILDILATDKQAVKIKPPKSDMNCAIVFENNKRMILQMPLKLTDKCRAAIK